MSVRAKFVVQSNKVNGDMAEIILHPVYGNGDPDHENTKFYKYTPAGNISLGCVNPDASKQFVVGQSFYVDFTACEG